MKRSVLTNLCVIGLVLSIGSLGCKHGIKHPTPIGGSRPPLRSDTSPQGPAEGGPAVPVDRGTSGTAITPNPTNPIPLAGLEKFEDRQANREIFKAYTIHYDFDSSVIKKSEHSNLEAVADQMKKGDAKNDLLIEGHCDERGTDGYNMALGERRALAAREYLINLGLGGDRIRTISYGKERPVDPGHDNAAWAKNRRAEFLLLLPKP